MARRRRRNFFELTLSNFVTDSKSIQTDAAHKMLSIASGFIIQKYVHQELWSKKSPDGVTVTNYWAPRSDSLTVNHHHPWPRRHRPLRRCLRGYAK